MKTVALILGVIAILMGLLWIGQGLNVVQWPASSFMIAKWPWAIRGAVLALGGLGLVIWSRRG